MKKFKCQYQDEDTITTETFDKTIYIEIDSECQDATVSINLSKTDAIEFCREMLKQISLLE